MHILNPPFSQKLLAIVIYSTLIIGAISVANAVSTIVMDGTTGTPPTPTTIAPTGTTYTINGATYGTPNGSSLLFSFDQFGIGLGDTALFQCLGCVGITNVIGRVTGANPSNINGALTSTIGRVTGANSEFTFANFWLFNPNGVILDSNAVVNIGFSTIGSPNCPYGCTKGTFHNGDKADRVIFSNSKFFGLTTNPNDSTLTALPIGTGTSQILGSFAIPTSFGFPPPVITPTPTPTPPEVVIEPPPLRISRQGDISMVVTSQPAMVNAVISPSLPKSCDKANGVLSKGVANYVPEISSQAPYSVLGTGATSAESLEQTQSSSLDESDGCL